MSKKASSVKQIIRTLKYDYLTAQKAQGGTAYGFIVEVDEWADKNEELLKRHYKELAIKTGQQVWGEKLTKSAVDQLNLVLDENPLPLELKYKEVYNDNDEDEDEEGDKDESEESSHYITVLTQYATLRQYRLAYMEVQGNANEQVAAADVMRKQLNTLTKRAKGNESRLVMELLTVTG